MSFSRTDSSPEAQRSGAAGVLLGYESSCFNHARYDALNRLATAATQSTFTPEWAQSYSYDGFGNLTNVTQDGTTILTKSYDANNHAGGEDANGNPGYISLPADGGSLYAATYDVENRLVATGSSTIFYGYAPGNKRVWKGTWTGGAGSQTRGTDEITFFSVSGQKLAAYALTTVSGTGSPQFYATQTDTNYYFGGKLIKNANGWVYSDRLASVGKFYPYGVERPSATTNGTEKFTGYFRDAETGNDYADQRYMSPGVGRFITPDRTIRTSRLGDPGSWNKYTYTGGDPVNRVDRGGTTFEDCIVEDTCDAYFNDPLFAMTILGASYDPNSPCFGEAFVDVSDACLASLWPALFQIQQSPPQPSCQISLATSGPPNGQKNISNQGGPYFGPSSNTLGAYSNSYGGFFAVQIQITLAGDVSPADWVYGQYRMSNSVSAVYVNSSGQLAPGNTPLPPGPDGPASGLTGVGVGFINWLDAPGLMNTAQSGAPLVAGTSTFQFYDYAINSATNTGCGMMWTVNTTFQNGVWTSSITSISVYTIGN